MRRFPQMVLSLALLGSTGCVTSTADTSIALHDSILDDKAYNTVLRQDTRNAKVYANFETMYELNVTYVSPRFFDAFKTRLSKLNSGAKNGLEEGGTKLGFVVSIAAPETYLTHLEDTRIWDIVLVAGDEKVHPMIIRYLREKERWSPFFFYLNKWSREYLIVFDKPVADQTHFKLQFSDSTANSIMTW